MAGGGRQYQSFQGTLRHTRKRTLFFPPAACSKGMLVWSTIPRVQNSYRPKSTTIQEQPWDFRQATPPIATPPPKILPTGQKPFQEISSAAPPSPKPPGHKKWDFLRVRYTLKLARAPPITPTRSTKKGNLHLYIFWGAKRERRRRGINSEISKREGGGWGVKAAREKKGGREGRATDRQKISERDCWKNKVLQNQTQKVLKKISVRLGWEVKEDLTEGCRNRSRN